MNEKELAGAKMSNTMKFGSKHPVKKNELLHKKKLPAITPTIAHKTDTDDEEKPTGIQFKKRGFQDILSQTH